MGTSDSHKIAHKEFSFIHKVGQKSTINPSSEGGGVVENPDYSTLALSRPFKTAYTGKPGGEKGCSTDYNTPLDVYSIFLGQAHGVIS